MESSKDVNLTQEALLGSYKKRIYACKLDSLISALSIVAGY